MDKEKVYIGFASTTKVKGGISRTRYIGDFQSLEDAKKSLDDVYANPGKYIDDLDSENEHIYTMDIYEMTLDNGGSLHMVACSSGDVHGWMECSNKGA